MIETYTDRKPGAVLAKETLEQLKGIDDLQDVAALAAPAIGDMVLGDGTVLYAHILPHQPRASGRGGMSFSLHSGNDWRLVRNDDRALLMRTTYAVPRGGVLTDKCELQPDQQCQSTVSDNGRKLGLWTGRHETGTIGCEIDNLNAPADTGEFRVVRFAPEGREAALGEALMVLAGGMGDMSPAIQAEFVHRLGFAPSMQEAS